MKEENRQGETMEVKQEQQKGQVKKDEKQKNDKGKQKTQLSALAPNYTESINFHELVDVALDLEGNIVYLIKKQKKLLIVRQWASKDGILIPPPQKLLPFEIVKVTDVLYHYHTKMNDDLTLFDRVSKYLHGASYLTEEHHLIACLYVFQTYLQSHNDIDYMAEILFFNVPERGKSRTGKAMSHIAYRGIHTVNALPASIFRNSNDLQGTIFFDVMHLWSKVIKNNAEDIFLGRFEKGATVSRVLFPDKGAFRDTKIFNVFGPTIIATNQAISNILGTRCMEIQTPYMPGEYADYKATDRIVLELKARLTAWKAKVMDQPLPSVEKIKGINGRLWDISKPLLSVCQLVCPERYSDLVNALLNQATRKNEDKKESVEGRIINIIYELSQNSDGNWIMTSAVLYELNEDLPEKNKLTSQWLGRKLKSLGIKTETSTGRSRIAIEQLILNKLYDQYGCKFNNVVDMDDWQNSDNSYNYDKRMNLSL